MPNVDQIIADAAEYATDLLSEANALVEDAQRYAQGYVLFAPRTLKKGSYALDEFDYESIIADGDPGEFSLQPPAQFDEFTDEFDSRTAPLDAKYADYVLPNAPVFGDPPPEIDYDSLFNIDRPVWDVDDFDEQAPAVGDIDLPAKPVVLYPDDPEGSDGLTAPEITAPTFDKEFEGVAPSVVANLADDFKADYASMSPAMIQNLTEFAEGWVLKYCPEYFNALSQLETVMSNDIENGNALSDAVEQRIYDRARSRALAEQEALQRSVTDGLAKRGFVLPPGAVQAGLAQAQQATSQNVSRAAAEVAIQRAQIELQHKQFCMQLSMGLRQTVINNAIAYLNGLIAINGQSLDYARQIGALAAEIFNQGIQLFNAQLDYYKAEAAVYETKLESAFAQLKVFQAQVEAEKLKVEVDKAQIDLYQAKIDAESLKIRTYVAELEGIQNLVALERLKVEVFDSKVRAYAARVGAKESEYGAYRAAIQGDLGKVQAYGATVDAYRATIQAEGVKAEVDRTHAGVVTDWNRHLNERYQVNLGRYETQVRGETARIGSDVDVHKVAVESYLGRLKAKLDARSSDLQAAELDLKERITQFEGDVKTMLTSGTLSSDGIKAKAEIATAGARVLQGLGTAALSVNNSIVSYSEAV